MYISILLFFLEITIYNFENNFWFFKSSIRNCFWEQIKYVAFQNVIGNRDFRVHLLEKLSRWYISKIKNDAVNLKFTGF